MYFKTSYHWVGHVRLSQEYIRKSVQPHIVVVKTSLSGFDVTAAVVVGREYG